MGSQRVRHDWATEHTHTQQATGHVLTCAMFKVTWARVAKSWTWLSNHTYTLFIRRRCDLKMRFAVKIDLHQLPHQLKKWTGEEGGRSV